MQFYVPSLSTTRELTAALSFFSVAPVKHPRQHMEQYACFGLTIVEEDALEQGGKTERSQSRTWKGHVFNHKHEAQRVSQK